MNTTELLIQNGQLVANTLRHLADNEIDSDYFAITSASENGTEIEHELVITDYALQAASTVEALVEALESAQRKIAELESRADAEPVAYMIGGHYLMHAKDPKVDNYTSAVPLYTRPQPAPVVQDCPKCGGTGMADSGGVQPWGEPIEIPCDCRAAMFQGAEPVSQPYTLPEGYALVPSKLTAENGAKGALSGEFSETKFISCPECFGDDECETCDGSGRIEITVPVSWTSIKEIWAKGVEHFAAAPQQEVE
ncbi:hypothetical protein [Atlantibacter hermannii]|uniref:hypothetical protein n=1 Tax=Atlantibacter hermannii TaxID=565 RepID=UPI001F5F86BD|nr:hypothetical protein [Atlantibacter hermannii]